MGEELMRALELYEDAFKDGFPTMAFGGAADEKMIDIINDCVAKKKDVYESGYLSLDDTLY